MIEGTEKFIIEVTDKGVAVRSGDGHVLQFTASEALMLLDILSHEEESLRRMAAEASPLPIRICLSKGTKGKESET